MEFMHTWSLVAPLAAEMWLAGLYASSLVSMQRTDLRSPAPATSWRVAKHVPLQPNGPPAGGKVLAMRRFV